METFNLISEYQNADLSKKLDMYMQVPELRRIFVQIDTGQCKRQEKVKQKDMLSSIKTIVTQILSSVFQ